MYNPVELEHLGILLDILYRFSGFSERCWIHFCLHKKNLIVVFSDNLGTVLLCLLSLRALEELSEGHETYILPTFYSKFPCTSAVMSHG